MSFQVHIAQDFFAGRYRVYLFEKAGSYGWLHTRTGERREFSVNQAIPEDTDSSFCTIPYEAAHAFLSALARQLGAVEHPEQLRHDYDAERARVDRLIGYLTADKKL